MILRTPKFVRYMAVATVISVTSVTAHAVFSTLVAAGAGAFIGTVLGRSYSSGGGGSYYSSSGGSYYSSSITNYHNTYIDTKPISDGLEDVAKAIENNSSLRILSREDRDLFRKNYRLDQIGPSVGILIDSAEATKFVREKGIDVFHQLIEDRIKNAKINAILAGDAILAVKGKNPIELSQLESEKAGEELANQVTALGNTKVVFEMIDLVRRNPNKTEAELLAILNAPPENAYAKKENNILPAQDGGNNEASSDLQKRLLFALKEYQRNGMDFRGIDYNNIDQNAEILFKNGQALAAHVKSALYSPYGKLLEKTDQMISACAHLEASATRGLDGTDWVSRNGYSKDWQAKMSVSVNNVIQTKDAAAVLGLIKDQYGETGAREFTQQMKSKIPGALRKAFAAGSPAQVRSLSSLIDSEIEKSRANRNSWFSSDSAIIGKITASLIFKQALQSTASSCSYYRDLKKTLSRQDNLVAALKTDKEWVPEAVAELNLSNRSLGTIASGRVPASALSEGQTKELTDLDAASTQPGKDAQAEATRIQ